MGDVRDLAEKLWTGEVSTAERHPFTTLMGIEEIGPGTAFMNSFANVSAFEGPESLLLVDTGGIMFASTIHEEVRRWSKRPVRTAVYTHGHADHVFGLGPFEAEAEAEGWTAPEVIGHEAVAARFDRYKLTRGYNTAINRRQFRIDALEWPAEYRYPDRTYRDRLELMLGDEKVVLFHDKGETDDHTWVWFEARKIICAGDLFIWAAPNCGNPQKAQRFPKEWAAALRKMAALGAETLLPGHGPPIFGADRVHQALTETAQLLETLLEQTLDLMNQGARLDDVLHTVKAPAALLERPYLRPIYDEPAFIVRNLWRLYGGWYDGNPAHLKPAPDARLASEIANMVGGAKPLIDRALALSASGEHALACHLAELARQADPSSEAVRDGRSVVYRARSKVETSLMAQNIFAGASEDKGR